MMLWRLAALDPRKRGSGYAGYNKLGCSGLTWEVGPMKRVVFV